MEELLPFFERAFEDMDKFVSGPLVLADFGVSVTLCKSCFECLVTLYLVIYMVNLSLFKCFQNVTSNCLPYGNLLQIGQLDFMPGRKSLCPGGEENPRDL